MDEVPPGHPSTAAAGAPVSEVDRWAARVRRRHAAPAYGAAPTAPGGPAWSLEGWLKSGAAVSELALALARHLQADADASLQLAFAKAVPELRGPQAVLALLQESGALEALADVIWREGQALRQASAASGTELHSKFLLQPSNITLSYAKLDVFFAGLEGLIGSPDANLEEAMRREHTEATDSLEPFTTGNYQVTTTSKYEWAFVASPDTGLAELGLPAWPTEAVLPHNRPELCRQPHPLADFAAEFDSVNQQLLDIGQPVLTRAEELGLRLYTGPMFEKYNTALRGGARSIEQSAEQAEFMRNQFAQLCKRNRYQTTIHVINSGLVKLSKIQPATTVFRGVSGKVLPDKFWQPNAFGVCGGVEYGFMSTTTDRDVAMQYASSGGAGILFEMRMGMVDRGADISWISQYPHEREICFAPLTGLERLAERVENNVLVVEFRLSINLVALTIEQVVAKRHKTMVELATGQEVETNKAVEDGLAWAPFRACCGAHWEAVRQELRRASCQDFAKIIEGKVEAMNDDDELIRTVQEVLAMKNRWAGPHSEAVERVVAVLEKDCALAAQQVGALLKLLGVRTDCDVVGTAVSLLPEPPAPLPADLGSWPHQLDLLMSAAMHGAKLHAMHGANQPADVEEVQKLVELSKAVGRYRKWPAEGASGYEACVVYACRVERRWWHSSNFGYFRDSDEMDEARCRARLRLLAACAGTSVSMPALLEMALEAAPWSWYVGDISGQRGSTTPTDAASFVLPAPIRTLTVSFRCKEQGWGNHRLVLALRRKGEPVFQMDLIEDDHRAQKACLEVALHCDINTAILAYTQTGDTLVLQYVGCDGGGALLQLKDVRIDVAPGAAVVPIMMDLARPRISKEEYSEEVFLLLASTPLESPSFCCKALGFLAACGEDSEDCWSRKERQILKDNLSDGLVVADLMAKVHECRSADHQQVAAPVSEAFDVAKGVHGQRQEAAAVEAWRAARSAADRGIDGYRRQASEFAHVVLLGIEPDGLVKQTRWAFRGAEHGASPSQRLHLVAAAATLWQVPLPRFLRRDVLQSPIAVTGLLHVYNLQPSFHNHHGIDWEKAGILGDGACGNLVIAGAQLSLLLTVAEATSLDLSGIDTCGVGGAAAVAEALAAGTPAVRFLLMRRCGLGPQGAQLLTQVLAAGTQLHELNVAENAIGDEGAVALAGALEGNCTLQVLSVAMNEIGPRGGRALAAALQKSTSLLELRLDGNPLGAAEESMHGVRRVAEVLGQAVRTRATYLTLSANHCDLLDEELDSLEVALQEHRGSLICSR